MNAKFILNAIKSKYSNAAIVPKLSIEDLDLFDDPTKSGPNHTPQAARPEDHKYLRRIDALMFESLIRTAIEIKVTKADFERDHYYKRRMWQKVTHRFIYAVPDHLDVMAPHGCGLWKINDLGKIKVIKKAIINKTPEPLPQTVIQRLAYRANI